MSKWFMALTLACFLAASSARAEVRFVNSLADAGNGTLREVVERANSGDEVRFNVTGEIHLSRPILIENKNISIEGPGATQLSIEGDLITQLIEIDGHNMRVLFSDLSLRGGNASRIGLRRGGAIYLHGYLNQLTINRVVFAGNQSYDGGAIGTETQGAVKEFPLEVDVQDCTFRGNRALLHGGAIYAKKTLLKITGSSLYENLADDAGAVYLLNAHLQATNSTFHRNHASFFSGAIGWNVGGYTIELAFVTITENTARVAGGGLSGGRNSTLRLINSIIADNNSGEQPNSEDIYFEDVESLGSNIIGSRGITRGWLMSDRLGTELDPLDPDLGPLKDNGGETFTRALLEDSPAISRAELCVDFRGARVGTDQRGVPRPTTDCDSGAFDNGFNSGGVGAP